MTSKIVSSQKADVFISSLLALVLLVVFALGVGGLFLFFNTEIAERRASQLVAEHGQITTGRVVDLQQQRVKYGMHLYPVIEVMTPNGQTIRFTDKYGVIDSVWPASEALPRLRGNTHSVVCVFNKGYCHVVSSFENRDKMPQYLLLFLSAIFIFVSLFLIDFLQKKKILILPLRRESSQSTEA